SPHFGGDFNRGDTITLASMVDVSSCYTNAADALLTYVWTLSPAAGDSSIFPSLSSTTVQNPTFIVDQASRHYIAAVTSTDKWTHHNSPPASTNFVSTNCGNNQIQVAIGDTPGAKPMDAHSLIATPSTVDADGSMCPSR